MFKSIKLLNHKYTAIGSFALGLMMTHCSLSGVDLGGTGTGTFPNDTRPSGTPVAQGQLTGQNGQTVSGSALIFQNGTSYTLRLEGLSITAQAGLQAQVYSTSSSSPVYTVTLAYYTGNKNFNFSTLAGSRFSSVYIYSTAKLVNYASALFPLTTQ